MKSFDEDNDIPFCNSSKYLKMSQNILLNSLRLQLNHPIKRKSEQQFILSRLVLFDKQFCLTQTHELYQTYLDFTSKYHEIWPVNHVIIVELKFYYCIYFQNEIIPNLLLKDKSVNHIDIKETVTILRNKIDQCTNNLLVQSSSRPNKLLELEIIDIRLKEFVRLHHIDLLRTIRYEKKNLEDFIYERYLLYQLSSFHFDEKHVKIQHSYY